jgi:hypothetical protein
MRLARLQPGLIDADDLGQQLGQVDGAWAVAVQLGIKARGV